MTLLSIGHGYCGQALARLQPAGWRILGTSRQRGADVLWPVEAAAALAEATHLVSWVPPGADGDPVVPVVAAHPTPRLRWIGYASASSVYGDTDGDWIEDDAPAAPSTDRGHRRLAAETAWQGIADARGLPLARLRIAGIYGPGRSAFDALRAGTAQRVVRAGQVFNRIHVDDLARAVLTCADQRVDGPVILSDHEPAPMADVTAHAATLLGVPIPPDIPFESAQLRPTALSFWAENKRLRPARLGQLGLHLQFPDYRAGLAAILAAGG